MTRLHCVVALALVALIPTAAFGGDRDALRGLSGVNVVVTVNGEEHFRQLVSSELLQSKVELKLRTAAIRVYEDYTSNPDPRFATLFLSVNAVAAGSTDEQNVPRQYAISMRMCVNQKLWVLAKGVPVRNLLADTNSHENVFCFGRKTIQDGALEKEVEDWSDMLVNDWLAAHSK